MFGNKRRLQREFKELRRDISSVVEDASLYQCDSLTTWRVTMKDFDEEMESAKDLAEDLVELKRRFTGFNGKITMELNFTNEYPEEPPLIRIVLPRMIWYTGFVTAGGSICAEFLVRGSQKYKKGKNRKRIHINFKSQTLKKLKFYVSTVYDHRNLFNTH